MKKYKIELTKNDVEFILSNTIENENYMSIKNALTGREMTPESLYDMDILVVKLTVDTISSILDMLSDIVMSKGLYLNGEPNQIGTEAEILIDKFSVIFE